jgi:hypothetical protein
VPIQLRGERFGRADTRSEGGVEHGEDVDAGKGSRQVDRRPVGSGDERPAPQPDQVVRREGELVRPEVSSACARLVRPDGNVGDHVVEHTEAVQLGGRVQTGRHLAPDAEPGR